MDISPAFGRGKSDDLPFLSLLALLCIFKKKKKQGFIFHTGIWLYNFTTADINHSKLDLHWAVWAACLSSILCINLQKGKRRNKIPLNTHLTKRSQTQAYSVSQCLVLWFSMSEWVPALGFIHCFRLKSLVYSWTPMCNFSFLFLPRQRHHPKLIDLALQENYYSLTLSHLVVKLPHSLDYQQETQNEHMNHSHTTCAAFTVLF